MRLPILICQFSTRLIPNFRVDLPQEETDLFHYATVIKMYIPLSRHLLPFRVRGLGGSARENGKLYLFMVTQGRSQGGSRGAREPPFCKPFFTKQPTTGGENAMTVCWP